MEQNYWTAKAKRDLGQDQHTCSLAEDDGLRDVAGSTQGRRRKAEKAVQKTTKVTREKAKTLTQSVASLQVTTLGTQCWALLEKKLQGAREMRKNKEKKCCHRTNNRKNGGGRTALTEQPGSEGCRRWVERTRNRQPYRWLFSPQKTGSQNQSSCTLHHCVDQPAHASHAGRDDSLLGKFPTLQDSVFTWKRPRNCPEECKMHRWKDTRKKSVAV